MKRILCECGHNLWKYVTEKKTIRVGVDGEVIHREYTRKICTKCQTKLK